MKRAVRYPLEAFVRLLITLREAKGVSQGELQKQADAKFGSKSWAKIISLWETGMRKKPDINKYGFVRVLDEVLGVNGALFTLYESPPKTIEIELDEVMAIPILAIEERKRVLRIKITKLLSDEFIEHSKATDWIEGWTAFFVESKFEMTDEIKNLIRASLTLLLKS